MSHILRTSTTFHACKVIPVQFISGLITNPRHHILALFIAIVHRNSSRTDPKCRQNGDYSIRHAPRCQSYHKRTLQAHPSMLENAQMVNRRFGTPCRITHDTPERSRIPRHFHSVTSEVPESQSKANFDRSQRCKSFPFPRSQLEHIHKCLSGHQQAVYAVKSQSLHQISGLPHQFSVQFPRHFNVTSPSTSRSVEVDIGNKLPAGVAYHISPPRKWRCNLGNLAPQEEKVKKL